MRIETCSFLDPSTGLPINRVTLIPQTEDEFSAIYRVNRESVRQDLEEQIKGVNGFLHFGSRGRTEDSSFRPTVSVVVDETDLHSKERALATVAIFENYLRGLTQVV